ncbi:LysR substrate-binding domain-containing protein [Cupriavidus plantarum]|uniref:DNA-binding transcriptional LysR family regulator n=2 Tax=Cupriavidus plantarum TaxID=942865 RepID=A0A316EQP3_9BURK|nr:LysR substrate-binding domain-containing protein [Cupriavidus plantarum]NYI00384.1 DNA-binding transcriptional LysR family regulator [Cupriavidus plantarum]PWK34794.1 DNA-binding transcriptional LysR family regulator [Cupriavidus plantarum]REE93237.1 DNA-binding transcriptional LysR family regulator [Cupriavidus plantarum]RLK38670.1 DNA-binding transcriptional LysR family regulator [Cupriavidus plantarum]CAG2137873.1 Glycine cleavage system transcriptional activator [Cupriavidus plantarum]
MRIPPVKAIVAFESVARNRSVGKAAEELGLTASAVSHQLANLEDFIGQSLFFRQGRGLVLTPVGEQYLRDVTGVIAELHRATERAATPSAVDILRVHTSPSFGLMWLLPRLESFQADNGDIQLNLSCSYEDVSFTAGFYDVDVRHGHAHWRDIEVRTLRHERVLPLASPDYLRKNPIRDPADLLNCRLINSETPLVRWHQWFARFGVAAVHSSFDFSFDRSYMSLETAALGLGVALESSLLASVLLRKGALVPVFEGQYAVEVASHHVVYPAQHADLPRVSRFLAWLDREVNRSRDEASL